MTGEIAILGIYVPQLFVLFLVAMVMNGFVTRLLAILGAYRLFNNRPILDITCFLAILGLLSWAFMLKGTS